MRATARVHRLASRELGKCDIYYINFTCYHHHGRSLQPLDLNLQDIVRFCISACNICIECDREKNGLKPFNRKIRFVEV